MDGVVPSVLAWGVVRLRDLPWRHSRDPWAVLVSEVMAQQTQVDRVVPKWGAFMERFPTPADCATAPVADVLRLWLGLGYPRRAVNLHTTAGRLVELGGYPDTLEGWLAMPGIGPYTARAVLAFSTGADVAVVDTNTARVLARWANQRLTAREAQTMADSLVPSGEAWAWNQVFMDLGAQVCRPVPRCDECPAAHGCAWNLSGLPEPDPAVGSAGVSARQARFEGSDRQARGRMMAAVNGHAVRRTDAARIMNCDAERAERLITALVRDGLVSVDGDLVTLP
jgi:A/G-specific adenine glycosylase